MADEPMIQLDETDFVDTEQLDVNTEAETQEPAAAEPSTEEEQAPDTGEQPPEAPKEEESKPAEDQAADEPPAEEAPAEDKPAGRLEQRKDQLAQEIEAGKEALGIAPNTEIRDLVSAQRAIREAVEARNSQVYAPQPVEDIMAETGQDESAARLTAMEQREQLRDWNAKVTEAQLSLNSESQRVLQEFPMFNPYTPDGQPNPQYQPQLAQQAATVLEANLVRDPNVQETDQYGRPTGKGMIVGLRATPYQIYKPIADAFTISQTTTRASAQRDAEKMLASAEPSSSAPPKEATQEDSFLAGLTKGLKS